MVGILRVVFGASGWEYYVGNFMFWAKMGAFLIMGLLTIPPTMAIRRWLKASESDAAYAIPAAELSTNLRYLHLQAGTLIFIPAFAAAMARGYGVS